MLRLLTLLLMMTFLLPAGIAEAPLSFTDDLTGVYTWPQGAAEADASYVYRYTYPQLAGDGDIALTINNIFDYEASDALGFECPMIGSGHPAEEGQMRVEISYEVVHQSDTALSVRTDKVITVGESRSHIIKGYTFPLTGSRAGTVTSLPYLLGIVQDAETDEWLIDRQIAKAEDCAREMVWALIEQEMNKDGSAIYEDMTLEEFAWGFFPEEDFYLDAEGNFVFYVQENVIAPQEAGPFYFTIALDDLLDEI